jgi:hypothetical protein
MLSAVQESEGMNPPHSQVGSHFGSWGLNRFLNFQKTIVQVKTHWIEKFFISLEKDFGK